MENYSILMSVYYKEKPEYLDQSIQSMINQTVKSNDFVLVCDGPLTPELDAVIEKYKDVLHVVRLKTNQGLGNALNVGLKECKNDIVARMDSDDISVLNRCEKQLKMFENDPSLGLLSAAIVEFANDPNEITGKRELPTKDIDIKKYSRKRCPMNHPVVMFRKSAVENAGGYSGEFHLFEDYYLWIRMLQTGVVTGNVSENLLYMRAPVDMFQRRGGKAYARYMLNFRWWMHKSGWSSIIDFLLSAVPQAIICVLPNRIRKSIYSILHSS